MISGQMVLVVEDDPDIAEAMLDVLMEDGFQVAHATNGQEALDLLQSQPEPAVILLDLMMPEMDGMQFRSAQLRDPRLAHIPVVVLSADRKLAEKARALGIEKYVAKPLGPEQLLTVVKTATEGAAA